MPDKISIQNNDVKKLLKISLIIWALCAIYLISLYWNEISHFAFSDTDDLMRYHQYSEWIKNGNWYLQPDPQFNPQDGVVMHWSRITDIPLALIAIISNVFTDWQTAFTVSNTITPLLYLLVFIIAISLLSYKLFNFETAQIAMLLPLISPVSYRFLPGALDHHNLQFLLLALFTLFIVSLDFSKLKLTAFFTALCIVFSLWIGLENIYSFAIALFILTLYGVLHNSFYLKFSQITCLYTTFFIFIALLLNRPVNEFFLEYYDVLSFPFLMCFALASIYCYFLNLCANSKNNLIKVLIYFSLAGLIFIPLIIAYPNLIRGGYADYPSLLKEIWLLNVSEAKPIVKIITEEDIKNLSYIIAVLPAILSSFFLYKKKSVTYWIVYAIFIINLLLALFWQVRMFFTALVCALPLQAYVCAELRRKLSSALSKLIILFLCLPTFSLFVSVSILNLWYPDTQEEIKYDNEFDNRFVDAIDLLTKNKVENKIILPTMDLGAAIIAVSKNSSIAAPYHRNIRGNTDMLNFYLTDDNLKAKEILSVNKIDYVLIDKSLYGMSEQEEYENSMMNRLYNKKNIPEYLELIDSNTNMRLYKFIKE